MLATLADAPLDNPAFVYELKYDGIRALIDITPARPRPAVAIWSRLGNDKTSQFPEIARAVEPFGTKVGRPVLVDGEIVALDPTGEPAGFQQLQGRIHLRNGKTAGSGAVAFIAFDLLRDGSEDLRSLPLTERRARLGRLVRTARVKTIRLSRQVRGDGRALFKEAVERGYEGLIAKLADSPYETGRRSPNWKKIKATKRQEFVIGGWTEPRQSRQFFGALLLGVYEGNRLIYVGHTGSGFTHSELARVARALRALETPTCPFETRPRTNQRPHWVQPKLVAEVKFTEWTADGKLRHPIYLGLRDDVDPRTVRRELKEPPAPRAASRDNPASKPLPARVVRHSAPLRHRTLDEAQSAKSGAAVPSLPEVRMVMNQLTEIEARGGNGRLDLPGGHRLDVTHLNKVFWPAPGITKGELMRYYARVAPFILPALQDRPLVMKRYPNGIASKAFYQHRAPDPLPPGVRAERLPVDGDVPRRLIGGSLLNLLYTTQLAAISQDPWFSRVGSSYDADFAAIDLDPMPGVSFSRVLDVARWVHDVLETFGAPAVAKTSGAAGLHIYVPLPPETPYETGMLFCQIVATLVADKHPKAATVRRAVRARGDTVYIDYLQNIRGKTLASAYSARASDFAGASTPLTWEEVDSQIDPREFTIRTLPDRLARTGDLWTRLTLGKPLDLRAVIGRATHLST